MKKSKSNIQKQFDAKADHGLRHFADGGPVYGPLSTGRDPADLNATSMPGARSAASVATSAAQSMAPMAPIAAPPLNTMTDMTPVDRSASLNMAAGPARTPSINWGGAWDTLKSALLPGQPQRGTRYTNTIGVRGADGGTTDDMLARHGLRGAIRQGVVRGGVKGKDSVDAKLMPGEYVIPTDSVQKIGKENLDEMVEATHVRKPSHETEMHHYVDGGKVFANGETEYYADGGPVRYNELDEMSPLGRVGDAALGTAYYGAKRVKAGLPTVRTDMPGAGYINDQMNEAGISLRKGNYADAAGKAVRGIVTSPFVAAGETAYRAVNELAPVGRAMTGFAGGLTDNDTLRDMASTPAAPAATTPATTAMPAQRVRGDEIDMNSQREGMTNVGGGIQRYGSTFTNVPNSNALDVANPVGTVPAGAVDAALGLRGGMNVQRLKDGSVYSPEIAAALAAASARGDHKAVQDFYQKNGGTFRGRTREMDQEDDVVDGLRKTGKGRAKLADYYASKEANAGRVAAARQQAQIEGLKMQQEQANKDRAYAMDVQKFGVETAEKNRAARDSSEKAFNSQLETRFRTQNEKGESVPDHAKIADFNTALDTTLPQLMKALQSTGKPEDAAKAQAIAQRGKAALEPGDIEGMHQLYLIRDRMRQSKGMGPNQGTYADSSNLFDYKQTGVEKRTFGGNRVVTPAGSVSANDLRYKDGPANAILPDFFKTQDYDLTRGLRIK